MKILIYSKDNCPSCIKAKALLTREGLDYLEVKVGIDILREDFLSEFPNQKTVPLIFINGEQINGYEKLVEYFGNRRNAILLNG